MNTSRTECGRTRMEIRATANGSVENGLGADSIHQEW